MDWVIEGFCFAVMVCGAQGVLVTAHSSPPALRTLLLSLDASVGSSTSRCLRKLPTCPRRHSLQYRLFLFAQDVSRFAMNAQRHHRGVGGTREKADETRPRGTF